MSILGSAIGIVYGLTLALAGSFAVVQAWLLGKATFRKPLASPLPNTHYPIVTVQLPVYNEKYVVDTLLACVSALQWPKECLDIQVLDDSTDETTALIATRVTSLLSEGFSVAHLSRSHREGYKAGALAEALPLALGEYIAVFDADFLPPSNFLENTIPYFNDPHLGMLQTRWSHQNAGKSWLTEAQAWGLDIHFFIEQAGRQAEGVCINFNGTAGVWRKEAIVSSGGWSADTLVEDLDLSIRSQLAGWEMLYCEEIATPAELPESLSGYRSQQYRWLKGGAECSKKLLVSVWKSKYFGTKKKLFASFHLTGAVGYVATFILSILSVPLALGWATSPAFLLYLFPLLFAGYCLLLRKRIGISWWVACKRMAMFLLFSTGLSLHHSLAVLTGFLGKKTPFVRTPKGGNSLKNNYLSPKLPLIFWGESLCVLYFFTAFAYEIHTGLWTSAGFHGLMLASFGSIVGLTLYESRR